ncbi:MAG: lipopolysaccharide biosynthesis protein [Thermoguttaceae bacterium]|nr:lipopolysaccharide biosynthesis protein [Thermoguttaceae bacterium]
MTQERLDQKTFQSAGPSLILQVLSQGTALVVGILMVRLLEPKDYGIWGILIVFWQIGLIVAWGGLGSAIIQKKDVDKHDLDSAFYYNMFIAGLLALALYLGSGWLADFFRQPVLKDVTRLVAWGLPIAALGAVQHALLCRKMRQDLSSLASFIGQIAAVPPALYIAWKGYGVWALAWQMFIAQGVATLTVFCFCRWLPGFKFRFKVLGGMFQYGSNIMFANLIDNIFNNAYNIIIGKVYPITTLGFYERGRQYSSVWPQSVQMTIGSVLFAAFSKIQDNVTRLRNAVVESLKMSVFIVFFPSLLIAALAVPFVSLILSEKWLPIVPYFQVLTLSFVVFPIYYLNLQILNARGRSGIYLGLISLNKLFVVINILCTVWISVMALVWGMVVVSFISLYFNTRYTKRVLGYGLRAQLWDSLPYLIYSLIASGAAYGLYLLLWDINHWLGLLAPLATGCVVYLLLNVFCYSPAFDTAWRLAKEQFHQWRQKKSDDQTEQPNEEMQERGGR